MEIFILPSTMKHFVLLINSYDRLERTCDSLRKKYNLDNRIHLGELIRASFETGFKLLWKNAAGLLLFLGVEMLLLTIIMLTIALVTGVNNKYLGISASVMELSKYEGTLTIIAFIGIYAVSIAPMLWMNIYTTSLGIQQAKGESVRIKTAIKTGFIKLPKFLLYFLMLLPVMLIISGPALFASFSVISNPIAVLPAYYFPAMGFEYLCILALAPVLMLTAVFLVEEDLSVIACIKKAVQVAKPQYFRTALYILLVMLLGIAVLYISIIVMVIAGTILYLAIQPANWAILVILFVLYFGAIVYGMGFGAGLLSNVYKQLYLRAIEQQPLGSEVE